MLVSKDKHRHILRFLQLKIQKFCGHDFKTSCRYPQFPCLGAFSSYLDNKVRTIIKPSFLSEIAELLKTDTEKSHNLENNKEKAPTSTVPSDSPTALHITSFSCAPQAEFNFSPFSPHVPISVCPLILMCKAEANSEVSNDNCQIW